MFKSVLLTVDLNQPKSWEKALPQAIELVRASGGMLHVATVIPEVGFAVSEGYFPPDFEQKALERAQQALDALVKEQVPEGISVKQHLALGVIHEKVLEIIEEAGCDLVVMASHEPDRMREFLVGSHADRVARRSPVSVLVIRG